jgi:hypothetical protein
MGSEASCESMVFKNIPPRILEKQQDLINLSTHNLAFLDAMREYSGLRGRPLYKLLKHTGQHAGADYIYSQIEKSLKPLYGASTNFEQLQCLMHMFYKGKLAGHILHPGPITPDMLPLMGTLIEINMLGYLTFDGQPGECIEGGLQRGYLFGQMRKDLVARFLRAILKYDVVIQAELEPNQTKVYTKEPYSPESPMFAGMWNQECGLGPNAIGLTKETGEDYWMTNFFFNMPSPTVQIEAQGDYSNVVEILRVDTVPMNIVRLPLCRTDLSDIVLDALKVAVSETEVSETQIYTYTPPVPLSNTEV